MKGQLKEKDDKGRGKREERREKGEKRVETRDEKRLGEKRKRMAWNHRGNSISKLKERKDITVLGVM